MHRNGFCCTQVSHLSAVTGKRVLFQDVSFDLHCGEMTVIIGRNGAGKTSLLRALMGELRHTGSISFHTHEGAARRLHIGYVPQRLPVDPSAPTSVFDLCAALLSSQPVFLFKDRAVYKRIHEQLEAYGAGSLIDQRLASLSGGEWQRVMLAMATDPVPELLILDEPASGVDRNGLQMLYEKLQELKRRADLSVLMVSHDFSFLADYADKVVLMDNGAVLTQGSPHDVLISPAFERVFGLSGGVS